jgi:hypothetical protein
VTSFTVSDSSANVTAALSQLNADSKMSTLAIGGTASGDTMILTGSKAAAMINLNGDNASACLTATSLTFTGSPDAVTLGTGASIIDYTLQPSSGVETIANFHFGLDKLDINLNGAANSVLEAVNATCNGSAIMLCSTADQTHGVVLTGVGNAASLSASHLTFSGGHALIA